ncbi:Bacteroides conjugative transposon TraM protein [Paenimyroides ummariense]|uniref:Bacteroides conjugative transposon TraM protein n=1 Tax=Paenimyroides ummariense TaxID=913024 RepID=A0A1I5GKR4_9FLAO|nr:conjugative transposon protein TraM [Paenimyroides ummariense]SFO36578.1 Bacteroides conjugative transposon TraM protein [Paenimyroides ummariense]
MKENENKKTVVKVTEGTLKDTDNQTESTQNKLERFKKPLIFGLMGIVFFGCMYLIFKPSEDQKTLETIGLNDVVPQASGSGLPDDKGKAYEQELLQQKDQEKRSALTTLADYWNTEEKLSPNISLSEKESNVFGNSKKIENTSNSHLNSYQSAQGTLNSFYEKDNSETQELRRQLEELKKELAEKDIPKPPTVDDQLALMEKSYQMAAKYLPGSNLNNNDLPQVTSTNTTDKSAIKTSSKESFVPLISKSKNTVSSLYREPTDGEFLNNWSEDRNREFYSPIVQKETAQPKNSIKAMVLETQTIISDTGVRLRLLESAQSSGRIIPQGTLVSAVAKLQAGRLQLKVSSIEMEGTIIPVDLTIYDLDGQPGLYIPYSPEMNAASEMAANMSQTSGSSLMLTQSAGQQVAADLSRGVIQGISGYFSKKARTPKVTLKAGHQVFLVSKN